MQTGPALTSRHEDGRDLPVLVWHLLRPLRAISSAPLGGGIGLRHWLINATVPMSYRRDDPDRHLAELARGLKLSGPGIGLLTGVDVAEVVTRIDDSVQVWATVGLGTPIWAAAAAPGVDEAPPGAAIPDPGAAIPDPGAAIPDPGAAIPDPDLDDHRVGAVIEVGTINIVAYLPARLSDAALVNAVATVTEAKAQAIWERGLPATGTATDAVVVLCPPDGPAAPYGGPRSRWGAPLARATRAAVHARGADPGPARSARHAR